METPRVNALWIITVKEDAVLEIHNFMEEVLPSDDVEKEAGQGIQEISIDTQEYMPPAE